MGPPVQNRAIDDKLTDAEWAELRSSSDLPEDCREELDMEILFFRFHHDVETASPATRRLTRAALVALDSWQSASRDLRGCPSVMLTLENNGVCGYAEDDERVEVATNLAIIDKAADQLRSIFKKQQGRGKPGPKREAIGCFVGSLNILLITRCGLVVNWASRPTPDGRNPHKFVARCCQLAGRGIKIAQVNTAVGNALEDMKNFMMLASLDPEAVSVPREYVERRGFTVDSRHWDALTKWRPYEHPMWRRRPLFAPTNDV